MPPTATTHVPHAVMLIAMWGIAVTGCQPASVALKKESDVKVVPVKTVAIATTDVRRTTSQPASVHAYYRTEINARVSGFVEAMHADIGDYVKAGAVLATLDVPELKMQAQVKQAHVQRSEAKEKQSQSRVELARAGVRSAEAKVEQAQAEMSGADASLAAAEAQFDRTEDLVERQSLQDRMLDEARKNRDSQAAMKDSIESLVNAAEADVQVARAELAAAEADLQAAQADTQVARRELDELNVQIDFAVLKAPFDGIVTERNIEPGDLVRAQSDTGNGKPLYVVSHVSKLRVRVPVPETDAPMVNQGDTITLTFPSFASESPMTATVTRTSGSLDPSTRTMMVEAEMENTDGKLLPGMFGQATIELSTQVAAHMLPARAIRFDETGKAYVYVLSDDDVVKVATVTTGIDDGNFIEITSGVQPGQRVIDAHLKRFTDGQKVQPL
ncbi:efflux RND transporter periplasmic adaptor subunit [Neorhodopirellula pilleata]|uniref:Multidrug resistance protein MdtA n=1 Tax=Neorhodopirellula pilleata TaxID=2714738 RepID=A0A5C6ACP8_9BACT|nr:efflux RND transporter periplasmic adaptor subunit [Neorhodopirellula pilleata]TWT97098.1 Multidrug resistance protein MdtA precursor [Neorhodopirellula pilleata]